MKRRFETDTEQDKRWIERTDHSVQLLGVAFGDVMNQLVAGSTILDVGAGDSDLAQHYTSKGMPTTRVDADYHNRPPAGRDWHSDDVRQLHFADESFDGVVSAYMMQHLNPESQASAMQEMVRVVKSVDGYVGYVGIFPVYDQNAVNDLLKERGLDGFAKAIRPDVEKAEGSLPAERLLKGVATLWIEKSDAVDEQTTRNLVETIAESGGLNRHMGWRDKRRMAKMALHEDNLFHGQA